VDYPKKFALVQNAEPVILGVEAVMALAEEEGRVTASNTIFQKYRLILAALG